MKLEQLFPKNSFFKLKATGKKYYLRPITIKDQIWIKQEYEHRLEEILNPATLDKDAICRIIYLLIIDKADFIAREIEDINEEGIKTKTKIGGYKLLERMIQSDEMEDVFWAFNENMGLSRPVVTDHGKKKVTKKKKMTKKKSKK